jgi:hypothetical protein
VFGHVVEWEVDGLEGEVFQTAVLEDWELALEDEVE